jgi:hypothetical protein
VRRLVGGRNGEGYIVYQVVVAQEGIEALIAAWEPGVSASVSPFPSPFELAPATSNERQDDATASLEPSFPTLAMLGLQKGWQQKAVWAAVSEYYNKRLPEPGELHAADLCRQVERVRRVQAEARGDKPPQKHPSEDTCGRFVAAYRVWYENQHHS